MSETRWRPRGAGWTRGRLLRSALGAGAVVAGGATFGVRRTDGTSLAAASQDSDAKILNLFLTLESVQERFYGEAVRRARLSGELLTFANAVGSQERAHVGVLRDLLGSKAAAAPVSDFGALLSSPERFREAAIELEEAAIAAYIGQAANLTRETVATVATLVSVEARQVAWLRDLAGISPAPHVADAARPADDVLADLRERGLIR
jgi:rubrerythrin